MRKTLTTIAVLALTYALPLVGAPELIVNWKMLVVMVAAGVMFMTQPAFSIKEAGQEGGTDRLSMVAILIAGVLGQLIPVIEWAYHGSRQVGFMATTVSAIGLTMMVGGLWFRIWSIRYLGRFFTATVQIVDEHQLVTTGPFAIVRHPSYLGAYVAIVGSAIFLNTIVGTVAAALLMAAAYVLRIRVEEELLGKSFGLAYIAYTERTPLILPRFLPGTRRVTILLKLATCIGLFVLFGLVVCLGHELIQDPGECIRDYYKISLLR